MYNYPSHINKLIVKFHNDYAFADNTTCSYYLLAAFNITNGFSLKLSKDSSDDYCYLLTHDDAAFNRLYLSVKGVTDYDDNYYVWLDRFNDSFWHKGKT